MVKSLISDRIIFSNFEIQRNFILKVKSKLDLSWQEMAKIANIHQRTLRDWSRRNLNMSYSAAVNFSKKSGVKLPKNTKRKKWIYHLRSISKKGGLENLKQNKSIGGNVKYRKEMWQRWWSECGQYKNYKILKLKKINIPKKDRELAEFVGIMMGDGGVAPYHISITLNSETDKSYAIFVKRLITKLFGVKPKIYKDPHVKALDIVVHRKSLVEFCKNIGLKIGNKIKQGLDIPGWILSNTEFTKSCIKGLVDTDGSLFIHSYKVKDKVYFYPKLSFTSASQSLIKSVRKALIKLGFNARISKSGKDVLIESKGDVGKYLQIIGSSNEKFWLKYNKWKVAGVVNGTVC